MPSEKDRPWRALTPAGVARLLSTAPFPWWIAGGLAIEFAAGHTLRDHTDIDVLILRRDHLALRRHLANWDLWVADPPGTLRAWPQRERLGEAVHDIWCRENAGDDWRFQVMLEEAEGEAWQSRRDRRVARDISALGTQDETGARFLAPEIVLFYKAKNPRPRDEIDFAAMTRVLDAGTCRWLADAIALAYGPDHAWLARLR